MNRPESSAQVRRGSLRAARGLVAAATLAGLLALALPADADPTPSAMASGTPAAADTATGPGPDGTELEPSTEASTSAPAESPDPVTTPSTDPTANPGPTASPEPTPGPGSTPDPGSTPSASSAEAEALAAAGETRAITLTVSPAGTPMAGRYFEDIGTYAFGGTVGPLDATHTVAIYRQASGSTTWVKLAQPTSAADGTFRASVPVTVAGSATLAASIGGPPDDADAIVSNKVSAKVEDATIRLYTMAGSIDSLKDQRVTGMIWPVRSGVAVAVDTQTAGGWSTAANTRTGSDGRFTVPVGWGRGKLASFRLRARYTTPNRHLSEISGSAVFKRIAVINAVVTSTTAAEVAKTYRAGCPVGRSKLKTITMNFYGFDKLMHRGVLIVRKDLTTKVVRGFSGAIAHKYPVAKMNNPNVYGGNDPKQMAADNTSGFNCRKVVGNPYRMSPHSYGIAIDVNTVRNPYRDAKGKWWPANGKPYIKRTPKKWGMLTENSTLTTSLRKDKFFWGGFWSPGKDYQHFEYRG